MNVASLENSKRLHELAPGWETGRWYRLGGVNPNLDVPKYDLGWLLRKLPATLDLGKVKVRDLFVCKFPGGYLADYRFRDPNEQGSGGGWWHRYDHAKDVEAATPEDAACLLLIELIEKGVVTP